ncbi:hypothetical protein C8T65DRAFT_746115 [Cerioporus squamosus]|nr:hypothetical protein C8T65DRAFT_746115 [Cerioporus squamosus]
MIERRTHVEIYHKALTLYLQEQPALLTDLPSVMTILIDHGHVLNIEAVHDVYNSLLIEEDYKTLRDLIDSFDNFINLEPVRELDKHESLEFRRLAAHPNSDQRMDDGSLLPGWKATVTGFINSCPTLSAAESLRQRGLVRLRLTTAYPHAVLLIHSQPSPHAPMSTKILSTPET